MNHNEETMKTYAEIKQEVDARSAEDWFHVLDNLDKCADREHTVVHLPFSSCWIFTTGQDCRWCMDPAPRSIRDQETVEKIARRLATYDFCVLSHLHADHYDKRMVQIMAESRTLRWVIPEFMAALVMDQCCIDPSQVTILKDGECFEHKGNRITAFPGYHSEQGAAVQVPESSFLAELPDGLRIAFPVDVRDYHQPIPKEMQNVDWLFSHVWLGRQVSHLKEFPMLDEFCRFNLAFKPKNILIGHLNETLRAEHSMWTYRHGLMVRKRLHELSPETTVICPRNGSAHILFKKNPPDYFDEWCEGARREFADHLGISLQGDVRENLRKAAELGIKVVELRHNVLDATNHRSLYAAVRKWREAGGKSLSFHLLDFYLEEGKTKTLFYLKKLGVDRVTEHVPRYSVAFMKENREAIFRMFEDRIKAMVDAGITVGIENMHTKPGTPTDEKRRYGLVIEEWLEFVQRLRDACGEMVGCHLDVGHAYTNYPFHWENTLDTWMNAGGHLINGIHIHQYDTDRSVEKPFPDGHRPITGRTAGFPLLEPLFRHWQNGTFRCPVIIEMRNCFQQYSFTSYQRLLDAWEK